MNITETKAEVKVQAILDHTTDHTTDHTSTRRDVSTHPATRDDANTLT